MSYYTADLNNDIDRKQRDDDEWLRTLPVCDECDEPCQDQYYKIDEKIICPDCMWMNHTFWVG